MGRGTGIKLAWMRALSLGLLAVTFTFAAAVALAVTALHPADVA